MSKNYQLKNGNYLKIEKSDTGYEYSLYDKYKKLIDGGILENYKLNDIEILEEVLKILNIPICIEYKELVEEIEEN